MTDPNKSRSLSNEIGDLAVKSDTSISELLRRCAVLAVTLESHELKDWAFLELNGYPPDVPLPVYRVFPAHARGNLIAGSGYEHRGMTIPESYMPDRMRHYAREARSPALT